ncbi:hypothetical protein TIFTF001_007684 [Ficus carica]|uniref:Uncharacterized protein n=1 Tax=Ficus carica TaxID=3494 RepID=A0AA87ZRN7_FICCA|nr:hypothetical protein TIFTF001_007684 [Ficus carica]
MPMQPPATTKVIDVAINPLSSSYIITGQHRRYLVDIVEFNITVPSTHYGTQWTPTGH